MRTGCQGWNYSDWVTKPGGSPVFYPEGTRQDEMLTLYSSLFDTVEVDSTFYAVPPEKNFRNWYKRTGDGFVFALKMPGEITHEHRLGTGSYEAAAVFCERARILKEKLGPVLIQLPPAFTPSRENAKSLRAFLQQLPRSIRFAVEFRHPGWLVDWTLSELANTETGLCIVEGEWIQRDSFFSAIRKRVLIPLYVRFMGARDLDSFDRVRRPQDLLISEWFERLEELESPEVYVYFSNLFEGLAPASVNKLRVLAGMGFADPDTLRRQQSLF